MEVILIVIFIAILVVLLLIGNLFTYKIQEQFIFRPQVLDASTSFSSKHKFEEIWFTSPNQGKINALYFKSSQNPKGIVLYFHGNTNNLQRWASEADLFIEHGYDVFMMDYRGFGKSKGQLSEKNFYSDAKLCYKYVANLYSSNQINIYGRSLGSAMACHLAATVKFKTVILETPFSSMSDLFYNYYPFLPRIFYFKFYFDNQKYLAHLKEPIYIFHGTKDWIVPYRNAKKLYSLLKPSDHFITIENGNHNNLSKFPLYQKFIREILT